MEAKEELWKRIRGALVGIAFGDSFGMPVEMWSREKIAAEYGRIREHLPGDDNNFISKGFKACEVTDDTINTILVIDMLSGSGGQVDPGKFIQLLKTWAETSSKSNTVIGPSTAKAMEKIAAGVPMEETGVTGTTNGAAMKILPIGLLHEVKDLDDLIEDVRRLCLPTHNTSPAISGACAVAAAVCYAANIRSTREYEKTEGEGQSADKKLEEMLDFARKAAERGRVLGNQIGAPSVSARLELCQEYMKKHTEDEVIYFIADIIGTGLPVEESVTAAISFVCLAKADLQKCAEYVVRAGGDTDTIAAIACGICGAFNEGEGITREVVQRIEEINNISFDDLADKLMEARLVRHREEKCMAESGI